MQSINGISVTPFVSPWLENSCDARILHVFDHACNLINERREVLSVVTPQIGDGPFNLVVEKGFCFSEHLDLETPVTVSPNQLNLGELSINTTNAKLWSPRPDWERLHAERNNILDQLKSLPIPKYLKCDGLDNLSLNQRRVPITNYQSSNSLVSSLSIALVELDITSAKKITAKLAGLGNGLTPAGDDFLMGAIYAAWIIHSPGIVSVLAREIANTAAPLTTSLSAAWLRAAGRGEAGVLWHEFFDALLLGDGAAVEYQISRLLSIGHTSGADALTGFLNILMRGCDSVR